MALEAAAGAFLSYVVPAVRFFSVLFNNSYLVAGFSALLVLAVTYLFSEQKKIAFMATAIFFGLVLGVSFKLFLGQERPCVHIPGKIPCPQDFSLPSMHSLLAFTLAAVSIGNRSFAIYLLYALFIAFSRVYLGVHLITEVAAGLALAFLACVMAELFWKMAKREVPRVVHIRHDLGGLRR